MVVTGCEAPSGEPRWDARLGLEFAHAAGRTRLVRRSHAGPLQVQRPYHPEPGGACHVYVLHPPGGLVGGDRLTICVDARSGAEVLLTTPAATKYYRTAGALAQQAVTIRVEDGATVEWLPQETIVFGGARARSSTRVDVQRGGRFLGWEICCLGRPASGDGFDAGSYVQEQDVRVDGEPVCMDRTVLSATGPSRRARWGMAGRAVLGCLIALSDRPEMADPVRAVLPEGGPDGVFAVTARRRVLLCRYLGDDAARAREGFVRVWTALRKLLFDRPAVSPRIWMT